MSNRREFLRIGAMTSLGTVVSAGSVDLHAVEGRTDPPKILDYNRSFVLHEMPKNGAKAEDVPYFRIQSRTILLYGSKPLTEIYLAGAFAVNLTAYEDSDGNVAHCLVQDLLGHAALFQRARETLDRVGRKGRLVSPQPLADVGLQ